MRIHAFAYRGVGDRSVPGGMFAIRQAPGLLRPAFSPSFDPSRSVPSFHASVANSSLGFAFVSSFPNGRPAYARLSGSSRPIL